MIAKLTGTLDDFGADWAIVDVQYQPNDDGAKGSPFHIEDLKPVQLARFDFEEYQEGRKRLGAYLTRIAGH